MVKVPTGRCSVTWSGGVWLTCKWSVRTTELPPGGTRLFSRGYVVISRVVFSRDECPSGRRLSRLTPGVHGTVLVVDPYGEGIFGTGLDYSTGDTQ